MHNILLQGSGALQNLNKCYSDYGERNHYAYRTAGGEAQLRPELILTAQSLHRGKNITHLSFLHLITDSQVDLTSISDH